MLGDDNDADMTLEDSRYRAKARKEIYERLRDIEWLFKTKKLSREERTQLKDEVSLLKARRQEIDAYERSENRQSSASPFFDVDYWINQGRKPKSIQTLKIRLPLRPLKPCLLLNLSLQSLNGMRSMMPSI